MGWNQNKYALNVILSCLVYNVQANGIHKKKNWGDVNSAESIMDGLEREGRETSEETNNSNKKPVDWYKDSSVNVKEGMNVRDRMSFSESQSRRRREGLQA